MQNSGGSKSDTDLAKLYPALQHYQPQAFKHHTTFPVLGLWIKILIILNIYLITHFIVVFNFHFKNSCENLNILFFLET